MTFGFKSYPIEDMKLSKINSKFGMRLHPVHKVMKMHEGVDYPANAGTPVLAVADGVVHVSKMQGNFKGYGNYVVMEHNGFYSLYAHLHTRIVRTGQTIKAGQIIGTVGSTGDSTGDHLHFGVCKAFSAKNWFDPLPYLENLEGDDEVVDTMTVIFNGKAVEVDRILKDNINYVKLKDFDDKIGICKVGYDTKKKSPTITNV